MGKENKKTIVAFIISLVVSLIFIIMYNVISTYDRQFIFDWFLDIKLPGKPAKTVADGARVTLRRTY